MQIDYHLFRAKFIRPVQTSFLHDGKPPSEILLEAIRSKPSFEFRQDYVWHIGNIEFFSPMTGYFAIGRTTKSTIQKFDSKSGNFIDQLDETSPYTHVVFDASIGFLAIARKSNLAPTTSGLAEKTQQLLSQTKIVLTNEIEVKIDLIPDPADFIKSINSAYAIKVFTATFTGPNPYDADKFFQKPLAVYLNAANGEKGRAIIEGNNLNTDVIEQVARSTASTGNTANAKIQDTQGGRLRKVSLAGDPVRLVYEHDNHDPRLVLQDAQKAYEKVRNEDDKH